jgi:hypothetical protein
MSNQQIWATKLFYSLSNWVDPWWWVSVSLIIFLMCLFHPVPLVLNPTKDHDFAEHVCLWVRRFNIVALVLLFLIIPIMLYSAFGGLDINGHKANTELLTGWVWDMFKIYWTALLSGLIFGLSSALMWHRYATPHLSSFFRKYRVRQGEDSASDMRTDGIKYRAKSFQPMKYFNKGFYFLGLDENEQPIYIGDEALHTTHMAIFGPTRFGKGVEYGILMSQAIAKGNAVFFIDPKGDAYLPYIMANEAKKQGRKFIYLDLNPEGNGYWQPFVSGDDRARRARILNAFGLDDTGTNADVYKVKERRLLDEALKATDGSIHALFDYINNRSDADGLSKIRDSLAEWAMIKTFKPPKKNRGHSIMTSLENNAVVYVRGSMDDEVIRLATTSYLTELVQQIRKFNDVKKNQITLGVDEISFLISNEVRASLATIAGLGCNMILATQAITDLRAVKDKSIDKDALSQSFMINCQIKLLYRAGDDKTAEYGEIISGTKWITQALRESTEINKYGGEKYDGKRNMMKSEVPLIHRNTFLSLPPMVGVLFEPHSVPKVMFTSFIAVDNTVKTWEKSSPAAEMIDEHEVVHLPTEPVINPDRL